MAIQIKSSTPTKYRILPPKEAAAAKAASVARRVSSNIAPATVSSAQGLTEGGPLRKAYEASRLIPSAGLPGPVIADVAHNLNRPYAAASAGLAELIAPVPKFTATGENIAVRRPLQAIGGTFIDPASAPSIMERVPYTEWERSGSPLRLAPRVAAEIVTQLGVLSAPGIASRSAVAIRSAAKAAPVKALEKDVLTLVVKNRNKFIEYYRSKGKDVDYLVRPASGDFYGIKGVTDFDLKATQDVINSRPIEQVGALLKQRSVPKLVAKELMRPLQNEAGAAKLPKPGDKVRMVEGIGEIVSISGNTVKIALASQGGKVITTTIDKIQAGKKPAPKKTPKSLIAAIREQGGIDPSKASKDANIKLDFMEEGLLGVLKKGGVGIDEMAATLQADGILVVPPDRSPSDYLMELLKDKKRRGIGGQTDYDKEFNKQEPPPIEGDLSEEGLRPVAAEDLDFPFGANAETPPVQQQIPGTEPTLPKGPIQAPQLFQEDAGPLFDAPKAKTGAKRKLVGKPPVEPGQGGVPYYKKLGASDAVDPARNRMRSVPQNFKLAYLVGWDEAKKASPPATPLRGEWVGHAWRAPTGYKHGAKDTAADVVKFETEELGNDLAVPPEVMAELAGRPASDIVWVTRNKSDAARYGKPEQQQMPPGSRIIAEDGDGGFLVLKPKSQATPLPGEAASEPYSIASDTVDGRIVRKEIPNEDSIEATLDNFDVLPGIREVPMSDFNVSGKHYSVEGNNRIAALAEQIKASGEISPLIVVLEKDGPYILEGATRIDALKRLGAKSFPAKVVVNLDSPPATPLPGKTTEGAKPPKPPKPPKPTALQPEPEPVPPKKTPKPKLPKEVKQSLVKQGRAFKAGVKLGTSGGIKGGRSAERKAQIARREKIIENLKLSLHNKAAKHSLGKQGVAFEAGAKLGTKEGRSEERAKQLAMRKSIIDRLKFQMHNAAAKRSIHKQGIAFEAGEKLGAKEAFKVAKQEAEALQKIKSDIKTEILERLPLKSRGKFITTLANARTPGEVSRAYRLIDAEADRVGKRQAIAELRLTVRRIMRSQRMSVDVQQRALSLVDGIKIIGPTKKMAKAFSKATSYVKRLKEVGQDVDMPAYMLERIERIQRASRYLVNTSDINDLLNDLLLLEQIGLVKGIKAAELLEAEKLAWLGRIVAEAKPLNLKGVKQRQPGEDPLAYREKLINALANMLNGAAMVDIALSPMNVVHGRMGTMETIKRHIDISYSGFLNDMDVWIDPIVKLGHKLGLKEKNYERIKIHAFKVQPDGDQYLLDSGISQEKIDSTVLTPAEMEWYNAAREVMEAPYNRTLEMMRVDLNKPLDKIDNYWPALASRDAADNMTAVERLEQQLTPPHRRKHVDQSSTKERVGGLKNLEHSAMVSFVEHMTEVAYNLNMGRDIRMLTEIAKTPEFEEAVGTVGQEVILDWLDALARNGRVPIAMRIAILDSLRKNIGAGKLGFKLSSILVQITALFDGAALLGPGVFNSFRQILLNRSLRVFLRDSFPELRDRGADDPAYLELSDNPTLAKYQQAGMWTLQQADLLTASGVLLEAYKQELAKIGVKFSSKAPQINNQAITSAQTILQKTQSSRFTKDQPLALSKGWMSKVLSGGRSAGNVSADRAVFQFQSFKLGRWGLIRYEAIERALTGNIGDKAKAAQILFWLSLATAAETGIRAGSRTFLALLFGGGIAAAMKQLDEEMKDWDEKFIEELYGTVPILGDLVAMANYRSTGIPVIDVFTEIPGDYRTARTGKKNKTRVKAAARVAEGIGSLRGVPGASQARQIVDIIAERRGGRVKTPTKYKIKTPTKYIIK